MKQEELRKRLLTGFEPPSGPGFTVLLEPAVPTPAPVTQPSEVPNLAVPTDGPLSRPGSIADGLAAITREIAQLRTLTQRQVDVLEANGRTTFNDTLLRAATGTTWGGLINNALPSPSRGFAALPLIGGLIGLLRGGAKESTEPPNYYVPPPPVQVEAGIHAGAIQAVSYGTEGLPRPEPQRSEPPLPPITIQVQAIDSRSFRDHSHEIARAVREAMLNAHTLTDVVSEL